MRMKIMPKMKDSTLTLRRMDSPSRKPREILESNSIRSKMESNLLFPSNQGPQILIKLKKAKRDKASNPNKIRLLVKMVNKKSKIKKA